MRLIKRVLYYQCNNTEVVGITTEKIICNILGTPFCTKRQVQCEENSYTELQTDISHSIGAVLKQMGEWEHLGHLNKACDFTASDGRTVSIKTNSQGDKVCPQNIGQPSLATFNKYFNVELKSSEEFKTFFLQNINSLLKTYLDNAFVCDDTILFMYSDGIIYKITRQRPPEIHLTSGNWTIDTTRTKETWKESNTIKVRNECGEELSLAEIQVHSNRNSMKFRFHLNAIIKMIENEVIRGLQVEQYKLQNSYVFKVMKESKCEAVEMNIDTEIVKENIILPTSFNYIGSKIKLLDFIGETIQKYTGKELDQIDSFMDCFAGTGVVSYFMIQKGVKKIISNDIQHYSAIISSVWTSKNINKEKLRTIIDNINKIMNDITEDNIVASQVDFVYNNYTPAGDRMYFTKSNGFKIDKVRQEIEKMRSTLTCEEYKCLLKVLLYAVTSVSNIASVYGAYLKKFKKSAEKKLTLDAKIIDWLIDDSGVEHITYNDDIVNLLSVIDTSGVECGYFDSPYNNRGYNDNYHVLQTISRYDYPTLKGKTGLRAEDLKGAKSFTSKVTTKDAFQLALGSLKSKYVFISYSSESIVSKDKMISIMVECGWNKVECIEQGYTRFKSNNNNEQAKDVIEYIFCGTRNL